jgi:hypothetical protein
VESLGRRLGVIMKMPFVNDVIAYTAGLFPEKARETYTITQVLPNGNDIEIVGNTSGIVSIASRIDYDKVSGQREFDFQGMT